MSTEPLTKEQMRAIELNRIEAQHNRMFKLLVAILHDAGGEISIKADSFGESMLLPDPRIVEWHDPERLNYFIKLKTGVVPK